MNKQMYRSTAVFKKALSVMFEEFDYPVSVKLPRWHFADTSGKVYRERCSAHMLKALNERFGAKIIVDRSRAFATKWIVCFEEGVTAVSGDSVNPKEGITNAVEEAKKAAVDQQPLEVEQPVEDSEPEEPVVEAVESSSEPVPFISMDEPVTEESLVFDKEYALSLSTDEKQESKNKLADYGEKFGITLKKNKTFENMLSDLEEHVKES
jgi:hypothetical protein